MALHLVAKLDQLDESKPVLVSVKGRSIGLVKAKDRIYAVRNVCPHKGAPVCRGLLRGTLLPSDPSEFVFGMEGQILQCPWHGWEFNLETGLPMCEHEGKRLIIYDVTVKEQDIYVEL